MLRPLAIGSFLLGCQLGVLFSYFIGNISAVGAYYSMKEILIIALGIGFIAVFFRER